MGSPDADGLVSIRQRVKLYALSAMQDSRTSFEPEKGARLWIQIVKGACSVGNNELNAGDGVAIDSDAQITVLAKKKLELLLFEVVN